MNRKILFLMGICMAGWGQSLRVANGVSATWNQPTRPDSQPYRVEFWMHDLGPGPGNQGDLIDTGGVAFTIKWNGGSGLWLGPTHRTIGTPCGIDPARYPNGFVVRYQYDPSGGAFGRESCEVFDAANGTRHASGQFYTATLANNSTTGRITGQINGEFSLGFLRIYSSLTPEGGRMPTPTDAPGDLVDFTFNNTLSDRSGSGRNLSLGNPVYVPSPPPVVVSRIRTANATGWSDSIPCRAGFPCLLDGTGSFTTAEAVSGLSYAWQQLSGPTTVRWSSRTSAQPSVGGMIFGSYRFRLEVSDGSGASATSELEVGAVATDDRGVVIHADPRLDTFFGPMIALGRNPWTWADERHLTGATLRNAAYETPGFAAWQTGTVSWNRNGICNTTLTGGISATDTTLNVADASGCDWSSFPVYLQVGGYLGEIVSICSRAGNVLTVCTYGRGMNLTNNAYSSGASVSQYKVTGTGTSFLTTLCPAGAGPPGTIQESGTVALTNGSAAITRVSGGTTWVPGGEPTGRIIRITDGSNVFVASISSVSSGTTANMSRTWSGTSANYTYHVLRSDRTFMALEWNDPDLPDNPPAPNGNTMPWTLAGCVSDTVAYVKDRYEAFGTGTVSGERYAWHKDIWLNGGGFGPNYYDEVLANYALYYRSGLSVGLDAARKLGRYWLKNPELMGGRVGGPPRTFSLAGATLAAVADGQSEDWPILRKMGAKDRDTTPCNSDLRETAYDDGALALKALFDPDSVQRANWKTELGKVYTRDNSCKGVDNSYPTSYVFDGNFVSGAGPDLTATNGSRDVTGTGIPSTLCGTAATGSNGTVSNGSTALTGSGFVSGTYIAVAGTRSGSPWIQFGTMTYNSATSITLGQAWQGDACSSDCKWYIFSSGVQYFVVGGLWDRTKYSWPVLDPLLADTIQNNACEWINSGLIRLALPFTGDTRSTYRWGMYNLMGNGTQVYMAGIKAYAQNYASKIDDGTLAANFTTLVRNTASWILNTGTFDPNDGVRRNGIYYARGFDDCEPPVIGTWHPYFCQPDANLNGEVMVAARNAYEADSGLRDKIDRLYGSTFGKPGWTTGGVYQSPVDLTFPADVNFAYKYYGLYFGMGFAHQWPAARLGGVRPAAPQDVQISIDLGSVPQAVDARLVVTAPSGAAAVSVCTRSPCTVTLDRRQGAHWVQIEYRGGDGTVLARGEPELLAPE